MIANTALIALHLIVLHTVDGHEVAINPAQITTGNEKGGIVSSVMAGVAFAVEGDGVGSTTESYAASALYTTLASLSGALLRIRRVRLPRAPALHAGCREFESLTAYQPLPVAPPHFATHIEALQSSSL